jgi:hypothetical protein
MPLLNNINNREDDELTLEERELLRQAESAQGQAGGIGSVLGGLVGGGLGALTGLFTAGATTIPGATLGASLGSGVGGALGNWLGSNQAKDAAAQYEALRKKRLDPLLDKQSRQNSLAELLGPYMNVRGM